MKTGRALKRQFFLLICFFSLLSFSKIYGLEGAISEESFIATDYEIEIEGKKVPYRAIAGNFILKDEKQNPIASLFWVSYSRTDVSDVERRPLTFCFNGGPGSSSVWLNLGLFGPKKINVTDTHEALPPYHLVDNPHSLLDITDIVFVDPVSTGFSHAIPFDQAKKFHGVEEDTKTLAEVIRLYLDKYNRWNSPKFVVGESYGSLRATTLASYLHQSSYIYLNGLILVSSTLNFKVFDFDLGNDLSYILFLPTYTATAWYHKKLPEDLQDNFDKAIQESTEFARNEYAASLFLGDSIDANRNENTSKRLARLTGLSAEYVKNSNLRVDASHFGKELLRDQQRTVGRFDSRFEGVDGDFTGETLEYDPSINTILGPYTAAYTQYIKTDLHWNSNLPYYTLKGIDSWDYGSRNQYMNVMDTMRAMLSKNQLLRVFVANGYYDLATPFFGSHYTFNHLKLDQSLHRQITMKDYPAGHMMYINPPSQLQMRKDLAEFFKLSLGT